MAEDLTIEELARETGFTTRNIRAHRTNGLIPPPVVRDSVGYYGREHLDRLRMIQELRAEGYGLQAVKRLLEQAGTASSSLLALRRAVAQPLAGQPATVVDAAELAERFGQTSSPQALERAVAMGELVPLGDGRYEVVRPALLAAAGELARFGISLDATLPVFERLRTELDDVAGALVGLFDAEVLTPFREDGYPPERWAEVSEAVEALMPVASQALLAVFGDRLALAVQEQLGSELERLTQDEA